MSRDLAERARRRNAVRGGGTPTSVGAVNSPIVTRWRSRLRPLGAVAASATAFGLYARVAQPWVILGWCGLVPWLAALDCAGSLPAALWSGWAMSVAFTAAVFGWFATAIAEYSGAPRPLGIIVVLLCAPLLQPQFVAVAAARHLARRSRAGAWRIALTGACAYVGAEWLVPKLFADTLGHGLYASALLRQGADIAGASGLTFVLLLANDGVLASLRALRAPVTRRGRAIAGPACGVAALAVALLGYGIARERSLAAPTAMAPIRAALVQGDISHYDQLAHEIGTYDAVRHILHAYFELSAGVLTGGDVDLLVWPETVYPTTFGTPKSADGATFDRAIAGFVDHGGVPLVFGSYDVEGGDEF